MQKNSFLKHFFVIGSGTVINMLIGLITTPLITRIVDPIEYGQFSIFTMYSNIAVMVLCLGLDQALVRYYYENEEIEYKRELLFKCIKLPMIISLLVCLIIISLSAFSIVEFEFNTTIMILLCIYTVIGVLYRFSSMIIRLAYKTKIYSILHVINKIVYLAFILISFKLLKGNNLLLLVVATIISVLVCLIVSVACQSEEWNLMRNTSGLCVVSNSELLKYSVPFIVSMGVTVIFQAIDKISLNYYCTYEAVGIYSSTMTLVHIFSIIQTTFNTVWAPMQVEHYSNNPDDHLFYQKGNQIITVLMYFLGITLILSKDVFSIILGAKYREAAYILPFLIFNPIMYTISETTVGGLVFAKKSNMQIVVAVGACITNIIGNTLLVPRLGCQGAAISTGISYIIFFTLRTVLSNRYFYTDFKLKKFYTLTGIVSLYALYNTFVRFNIWSLVGYAICLIILFILSKDTVVWGIQYLLNNVNRLLINYKKRR